MRPALPFYAYTFLFVLTPIVYTVILSFMTRTDTWKYIPEPTLANYEELLKPIFRQSISDSMRLAFAVTILTVIVGYPAGLALAGLEEKLQRLFLQLIMFTLCINSVVRISGVIMLLRSGGPLGFLRLLYTRLGVILTMVYAFLPYMIYSVYSASVKLSKAPLEASRVLGANPFRAFLDITLPLTAKGLLTGVTLTFIPSMGIIYISDLIGGGKTVLVGNLIQDQLMRVHNLPQAAALSVVLILLTGTVVLLANRLDPVSARRRRALRREKREAP